MKPKYVLAVVLLVLAVVEALIGSRNAPGALTELQARAEQRAAEGKPAAAIARESIAARRVANPWRIGPVDDIDDQPEIADYVANYGDRSEMPTPTLRGGPIKLAVAGMPVMPPNTALIER